MHFHTYDYRHAETILNANLRLKREIESVLTGLDLDFARPHPANGCSAHRQIQQAFLRQGWEGEALVSRRTRKRQFFDLYKERVAIEIELSNRERLYRDYLRFLLAEAEGRIDVGVILLVDYAACTFTTPGMRAPLPQLAQVEDDLRCLRAVVGVPIWVVALH